MYQFQPRGYQHFHDRLNHKQARLNHAVQQRLCNLKSLYFFRLCSRHAQRKYDHGDVQSESNSDDNAWGILQLLAWMLVHEFRHAAVGILQVISEMVMLLALFFFFNSLIVLQAATIFTPVCAPCAGRDAHFQLSNALGVFSGLLLWC